MNEGIIREMKIEDIPPINQPLARQLGIETYIKLAQIAGGTTIYIPKADSLLQPARDRCIIKEFNGSNYKELAIKYNLSESWVRQVIQQDLDEKSQIKLFDNIDQVSS
jgi:Mor family transcriptional regulator